MLYAAFESPKWLVTAQREPEAIAALKAIRGHHVSDAEIHEELYERGEEPGRAGMDQAQESNSGERQSFDTFSGHVEEGQRLLDSQQTGKSEEKVSLVGFITQPEYRKALICVVGIMFAQQLTGKEISCNCKLYGLPVTRSSRHQRHHYVRCECSPGGAA